MGSAFPRRGRARLAGSFVSTSLIAEPNCAGHMRQGRGFASATLYRRANRRRAGVSTATVSRILKRLGLNRLAALEPIEPVRRYERAAPGEILHIDIKKLGRFNRIGHRITGDRNGQSNSRGVGWEYLHLAIDDHSRVAYSEILPDEKRGSCLRFLLNALRFFRSLDVKVRRVMTDNGSSFRSRRYAKALRRLNIKHLPHQTLPQDQQKRPGGTFRISLREWAYAQAYPNLRIIARRELPLWLHRYNWHRPLHAAPSELKAPISRSP